VDIVTLFRQGPESAAITGLRRCDHLIDFAPYGKCIADQAI
jgi:hypothetical protein